MREEERGDEKFKQVESLTGGDTWRVVVCQARRVHHTRRQGASVAGLCGEKSFWKKVGHVALRDWLVGFLSS